MMLNGNITGTVGSSLWYTYALMHKRRPAPSYYNGSTCDPLFFCKFLIRTQTPEMQGMKFVLMISIGRKTLQKT